jgi:hypothetical protein
MVVTIERVIKKSGAKQQGAEYVSNIGATLQDVILVDSWAL